MAVDTGPLQLSNCCHMPVATSGGTATNFYICSECGKPCDVWIPTSSFDQISKNISRSRRDKKKGGNHA